MRLQCADHESDRKLTPIRAMLSDYDFSLMLNVPNMSLRRFVLWSEWLHDAPFSLTEPRNLLIASREEGASPCACMLQTCSSWKDRHNPPAMIRAFLILSELRPKRRLKPSDVSGHRSLPGLAGDRGSRDLMMRVPTSPKRGETERELDHGFQSCNCRRHR
ncbi:hypothetical protein SZ54_1100 [Rhizobium sp. UR51a]|nr:hypothetical protein SZ54_1100 [Rhizobium sp. UR51a]